MSFSLIIGEDMKIAIDGPAGSGKSTIAKLLSKKLNFEYIDTGALYRAITYIIKTENLDAEDEENISNIIKNTNFRFHNNKIYVNEICIESEIRKNSISKNVSDVAALPFIRNLVNSVIRKIVDISENIILDGRDIGTVVLPDAELKIFLDATPGIRAKRRYLELLDKNESISLKEIKEEIIQRDYIDSNRDVAPLRKAVDAIVILTDDLNIQEVVDKIYNLLNNDL
ncbi:MAG: cytidylate kinase [Fusobacteria bacterium]|nr:MAG: cytidylate kinase [Fusobacteriota bacterium]KAF0229852.1 MAG: cytidylate [Fusobacteriota bacterium]